MNYCPCVFLFYFVISNYQCLKMIPERAELIYFNKFYFEDPPIVNVRRYNRKGDYVINMFFQNSVALNNTVTMDIIFYEYLHNEFRRSFIEGHYKMCDLINNDPYIGNTLRAAGMNRCPIQPGKHAARNMTFHQVNFPSVWPFEKGMCEFIVKVPNNLLIAQAQVVMSFKLEIPKPKKI